MKILFLTIGNETVASSRARIYGYTPFLIKGKIGYKILTFTSKKKCRRILDLKQDNLLQRFFEFFYKIYIVLKLFMLSKKYDIIFIQKVLLPKMIWKALKVLNRRIIFDFDDAIYLYKDITYLLKGARCIVVSNKYLKEYVSKHNKKIYELISPVNINSQLIPKKNDLVTLGWTGSPETSGYLYPLIPVLKNLKERFNNLNIEFMGADKNRYFDSLDVKISEWSIEREKKYLENIDIGIMPLVNDEWSQSKAGYKILRYMSMGVPCVASPVGINNEIIKNGINGYLSNTPGEWLEKLSLLIENCELRQEIGEKGRRTVKKYYSYDTCAPKMINIFVNILREI